MAKDTDKPRSEYELAKARVAELESENARLTSLVSELQAAAEIGPMKSDVEIGYQRQIADLKRELTQLQARNDVLERLADSRAVADKVAAKAKADAPRARFPFAKMRIIGTGHRFVKAGEQLEPAEIVGLTEGVHYDLR